MLDSALLVVMFVGFAWGCVVVHEYGHFITGRLVGVPAGHLKVVMASPPHTALKDGGQWRSPDDELFIPVFRRHCGSLGKAWWFIAGGFVIETAVTTAGCVALILVGQSWVAVSWASTSLAIYLLYVIADAMLSWRRRSPYGDATSMWHLNRIGSVTFLLMVVAVKSAMVAGAVSV